MSITSATQAYTDFVSPFSIKSNIETEVELLTDITRKLRASDLDKQNNFSNFANAVYKNRKIWTIFASNVAHSENKLSADLKANIFYLSEFVHNYSRRVLKDELDIDPLIEVNAAVLRGLTRKEV